MEEYDYKEDAGHYDEQVKEYNSYTHDIIFGMSYEYIKPGEKILDLGIGTGLASINFYRAGLKVYGLDNSNDMLRVCRSKSFTEELKQYDLRGNKLPFSDNYFNHIISCGVFHFLDDLENIFSEASRIMINGGKFAFTFAPGSTAQVYTKQMTDWGIPIYKHSPDYISRILDKNRMKLLKEQRLLMKGADKVSYVILFSVVIAEYNSQLKTEE
jgi:ubiquinone/menaquinone biosynthesis C-methylase UbiE